MRAISPLTEEPPSPQLYHERVLLGSSRKILLARMQLSRGLLLGMDIMVVSDVIETLCGQVDLVKLLVIVAVRSWLGYERTKEMQARPPESLNPNLLHPKT